MSNGSMFSDFDGLAPIGRARVRPQYGSVYHGRRRDHWYPVLKYGEPYGLFIDSGVYPRWVVTEHFEVVDGNVTPQQ